MNFLHKTNHWKFLISFFLLIVNQLPSYAQTYCDATNTDCNFEVITNVNLSNLNNTSGCGLPYDDYTSMQAHIVPGTSYSGTITKSDILANYIAVVFIDWDNNGTFDATEQITTNLQGTSTFTFTVTSPVTAVAGLKRMRVRMGQNALPAACGASARGDIEDYTINLTTAAIPAPANNDCSNAISFNAVSSCSNTGGTTFGATQSFAPNNCGAGVANDVWYTFISNGVSEYEIRATGTGAGASLFDPVIELYSSCTAGGYISCINATGPNLSEVVAAGFLPAGTYYYRIYASNGARGNFTTCVVDITPQPNNECDAPLLLTELNNNCSAPQRYNNIGATPSSFGPPTCWTNVGTDVWFRFVAVAENARIDVFGQGSNGNTLQQPQIALYSGACAAVILTEGCAGTVPNTHTSFLSLGGLTVGTEYLIRVSSANDHQGTFQFCINNFTPPVLPGQDCITARTLCTKDQIIETDITGYGADGFEASSSCLAAGVSTGAVTEQNSTWYVWTAADNGTIGFTITPGASTPNLDIDFVVYQLDPANGCAGKTQLRCMGSSCVGPTGLNASSIDVAELSDCDPAIQDNFVQEVTMMAGQRYGLLINNFQNGGSGYTIDFNGTGNFLGPQPAFDVTTADPCVVPQSITITDESIDVDTYLWNFGVDANPASANTAGPHNVTYSTSGIKTISLIVTGAGGCDSLLQRQYVVAEPLSATTSIVHSVCDGSNGSITVNATGGNGATTDLMYSIDGQTPQSSNVFSNLVGGTYDLAVIDTSNCTYSLSVTVQNTPTPIINPIANVIECQEYILPAISGTNLTGSESYYTMPNGGGVNYQAGQAITTNLTLYAYDATTTTTVCSDEEMFTITINNAPGFQNLRNNCAGMTYTVSFDVVNGDPSSYSVTTIAPSGVTGSFSGNTWTSSHVTSGVAYTFEINDNNNCPATVVSGLRDCNCVTEAGTMNSTPITECGDGPITATHNAGTFQSDGNDIVRYVLHTNSGPSLGTVIATSTSPTFSFGGGTNYNVFYYISAIAGNNNGSGNIDDTDPCFSVASGTPVRWRQAPTADFSGSTSICNGQSTPLTYSFVGVSPFNVTYFDGTSNTTVTNLVNNGTSDVSPTITRNYSLVSVTGANGCLGTVAPTIVSIAVTNPPLVSDPSYTCNANNDGYTVQFNITDGNGGPYTVTPISPAGAPEMVAGNFYSSSFDVSSGTAFTFEVDDANGCGPVIVTGTHNCACESSAGLMPQTIENLCENELASPTHNQATMALDNDDVLIYVLHDQSGTNLGSIVSTNNANSTFGFQGSMTFGLTYYISAVVGNNDGSGSVDYNDPCLAVSSGTPVRWNQTPSSNAGVVANPICAGSPLELTSSNNSSSLTHSWTHSASNYTSNSPNPIRTPSTTGMSGTYTLTVTENGCSSTSSIAVTVNAVPNSSINNAPSGPFCTQDGTVQFTAASSGGTWSGAGITNANQGTFNPQTAGAGNHTITYTINGVCPSSSTKQVVVSQSPVFDFIADVTSGCTPLNVTFSTTYNNADAYAWSFENGTANTTIPSANYTFANAGVYDISLTISDNGCNSTVSKPNYITANQTPVAGFEYFVSGEDGLVVFENNSLHATSYDWSFGDNETSVSPSPDHQYATQGTYNVTLKAIGDGMCTNSITIPVTVNTGATMYIPNSFSPNGDDVNQTFVPVLSGDIDFSTYRMRVFNRWGEILFESKDPNIGWDGTFQNKLCDMGIYTYDVYFKNLSSDKKTEQKGNITLIR